MPRHRATKVCPAPGCPLDQPCPHHTPAPWAGSQRRERIGKSGWQQQRDAQRILKAHRGICHICGHPGATEVDHITPLSQGGTDDDNNKAPIHPACHQAKTANEATEARRH